LSRNKGGGKEEEQNVRVKRGLTKGSRATTPGGGGANSNQSQIDKVKKRGTTNRHHHVELVERDHRRKNPIKGIWKVWGKMSAALYDKHRRGVGWGLRSSGSRHCLDRKSQEGAWHLRASDTSAR